MCQVRCQLVLSSKISIDKNKISMDKNMKNLSCQSDHSRRATFALRMC